MVTPKYLKFIYIRITFIKVKKLLSSHSYSGRGSQIFSFNLRRFIFKFLLGCQMKQLKNFLIILLLPFFLSCSENIIQPDEQFVNILFKYDFRNELNTFNNSLTKRSCFRRLNKNRFLVNYRRAK
jgi:hypothetical protein